MNMSVYGNVNARRGDSKCFTAAKDVRQVLHLLPSPLGLPFETQVEVLVGF